MSASSKGGEVVGVQFSLKKDTGLDFLRFLHTEKIVIDGLTKSQMKQLYNVQYKQYKSQIDPDQQPIPFGAVIQTLFTIGRLHLRQQIIFSGPPPPAYFNSKKNQHGQNAQSQTKNDTDNIFQAGNPQQNAQDGASYNLLGRKKKHKKRVPGSRLAVDQHITFNKPLTEEPAAATIGTNLVVSQPLFLDPLVDDSLLGATALPLRTMVPDYVRRIGHAFECVPCSAKCTSDQELSRHLEGRRHRLGVLSYEMKKKRDDLMQDKNGIEIKVDCGSHNGAGVYFVDLLENTEKVITLTVYNRTQALIELAHCEMLKRIRVFNLDDEQKITENMTSTNILPGTDYKIKVIAKARNVGNYHTPIGFHFRLNNQEFHIIKMIHARCKNAITDQVKPSKPFKRPPRAAWRREATEVVPGLPLPNWTGDNLEKEIPLEQFKVPDSLRKIINRGLREAKGLSDAERVEQSSILKVLDDVLKIETFSKVFETLNFFEEVQMEVDIRKYDMECVTMTTFKENKRLLLLEVPGLAENRPSVLRGDCLYVRINRKGTLDEKEYQGFVHEIRQNQVVLGFSENLMKTFVNGMEFNVRFVFNRLPLRLQHRACVLSMEENLNELLFPSSASVCSRSMYNNFTQPLRFYNKLLEDNEQQKTAIQNILSGVSRPAPYIVFGPPGTGKTVTIVEAMMQIWKCQKGSHILACAPSNSAADLITQRLLKWGIQKSHILRLNASSRSWMSVPDEIKDVCNMNKQTGQYFYPRKDDMKQFRVVICTLVTAGRLVSANFESGHFTHIFVDESGHAVEPECLIPLAGILCIDKELPEKNGQVVLAGDPEQLGPILRSPYAIKYGLEKSMLERLMTDCDVYHRRQAHIGGNPGELYDNRIITKLLRNYRSHPTILHVPNQTFYDGELVCCAEKITRESFCRWDELPNKDFPVLFHGVIGKDEREERSPSFFNAAEVSVVIDYVEKILNKRGGQKVSQKDIGIISPYRKQVQKIQQILKQKRWKDISVGSVEEFQGQERLVIIVSTVRSNPDYLSLDVQFKLGFLKNPKRFNVTLTRAKALLIVVGNPFTLSKDRHWGSFIDYCQRLGGYRGEEMVEVGKEDDMIEDALERIHSLHLFDAQSSDESEVNQYLEDFGSVHDKPWRDNI